MVKQNTISATPRELPAGTQLTTFSYNQDPYLPCRFFGEIFNLKAPRLDNHLAFTLNPNFLKF